MSKSKSENGGTANELRIEMSVHDARVRSNNVNTLGALGLRIFLILRLVVSNYAKREEPTIVLCHFAPTTNSQTSHAPASPCWTGHIRSRHDRCDWTRHRVVLLLGQPNKGCDTWREHSALLKAILVPVSVLVHLYARTHSHSTNAPSC